MQSVGSTHKVESVQSGPTLYRNLMTLAPRMSTTWPVTHRAVGASEKRALFFLYVLLLWTRIGVEGMFFLRQKRAGALPAERR